MGKYQAYPEYEDSGVEWIGSYPIDWKLTRVKFESYVKARVGWHGLKSDDFTDEGPYLVTGSDFKGPTIQWENCYHCDLERYKQDPYIQLRDGDLLITKDGTIGKVALVTELNGLATLNSGVFVVRPLFKNYISRFYFWLLQSSVFTGFVDFNKTGSTIVHLYQDTFVNFKFAMPEVKTQEQIANFLDHETAKIDTLIEQQQQLIQLLKEKRQAVISHAVTKGLNPDAPMKDSGVEWLGEVPAHWMVSNLDFALIGIGDVDHYMPKSVDTGIPYVMTGDLKEFASNINFEGCKQISLSDYTALSKKIKCTKGDVIMARYATIGTVSYVDIDMNFVVSYSCVTIKPNLSKVIGLYLYYYFKSDAFLQGIQSQINTNTQGNVGISDLKKIKIAIPPLPEQELIIQYLQSKIDHFDYLSDKCETSIQLAQERRTALISAAVTGKIDVRNWQATQQ